MFSGSNYDEIKSLFLKNYKAKLKNYWTSKKDRKSFSV